MPFTPFHFGPASIAKALAPRHFSFTTFGLSQFVIDLEPAWYMARDSWPIHRFFHTYPGATIVALAVVLLGRRPCEALLRLWNRRLSERQRAWLSVDPRITVTAAAAGAVFGAWSHVLLDSIMHADMQPFAPFSIANPLLHAISIASLHEACVTAGVLGAGLLCILLATSGRAERRAQRRDRAP